MAMINIKPEHKHIHQIGYVEGYSAGLLTGIVVSALMGLCIWMLLS